MTDTKPTSELLRILESIHKPLLFASKDNFAHLHTVKSLEGLVAKITKDALEAKSDKNKEKIILELQILFNGFDNSPLELKKERVSRALELFEELRAQLSLQDAKPHEKAPITNERHHTPVGASLQNLKKLSTPLQYVKGIGPKLAERFESRGMRTVEDMLYFLPNRYEDRRRIKKIKELVPGQTEVSSGEVAAAGEVRYGRKKLFEVAVTDGSSYMILKWFNYRLQYITKQYQIGKKILFYGQVSFFGAKKEIIHPEVEFLDEGEDVSTGQGIVPVYTQIDNMYQKTLRKLARTALDEFGPFAVGAAPRRILQKYGLVDLKTAFREAHTPTELTHAATARRSLAFDELFSLNIGLALKKKNEQKEGGVAIKCSGNLETKLRTLVPFILTNAQERVLSEIKIDMAAAHPMHRLVQGDVGSGKTIVSLIAALNAIECGYQAAIMAPTEILAEQHYLNMHAYAERLGVRTALLTNLTSKAKRKKLLEEIKNGDFDLLIGTHALIQKDVEFKNLGLAVIDEQHRFGVVQRAELKKKGAQGAPDILVMTATPIPRTLSMTVYGDLDVSIIDELPKGRKPITTKLFREKDRLEAYRLIIKELNGGSQCYVVYPLVEESEELPLRDATRMKEHLEKEVFHDFNVGLLHGRMKSEEKEAVMTAFKKKELDVLVATTVIEVGVDVPNATIMLIEHAERFGLAQLHQLRGRVGRGEKPSYCILLAQYTQKEETWQRLRVMELTTDGFKIAEEDLRFRGPGDFIGTRQSGLPEFRSLDIFSDTEAVKGARDAALDFISNDPELKSEEGRVALEVVKMRWKGRLELAEVG